MSAVLAYTPAYPPPGENITIPVLVLLGLIVVTIAIFWVRGKPPTL